MPISHRSSYFAYKLFYCNYIKLCPLIDIFASDYFQNFMDQFIVSARKYRPITFDSVVGQRHVGETLKNAIRSNHLAQAFLFNGPRGVGKTTCARILAKTINCFNRNEEIEACEECESCKSFNEGHSLNVYELDAASNNSVDGIRALIDQVRFAPQIGTKKVYIIDEVHMLSNSAFNAFLKTLEEPPAHAIFILATTEKHKVLPTVLSRCQVFDFNRIEINDIVRHLQDIAEKEKIKADEDGLNLLALKSDGSLRDALSMFDQMVTYSGEHVTYDSVIESLSILSLDHFFQLTDHLVQADISKALLLFNDVLLKGFDGHNFVLSFAEHLRNLLVSQDHDTIQLLTVGDQIVEKYKSQTLRVSSVFLIKSLNLLSRADIAYKTSHNQRLLVELTLINIASLSSSNETSAESKTVAPSAREVDIPKKKSLEPTTEVKSREKVTPALVQEISQPEVEVKETTIEKESIVTPVSNEVKEIETQSEENLQEQVKNVDRKEEIEAVVTKKQTPIKSPSSVKSKVGIVSESISISDYTKEIKSELSDGNEDEAQLNSRSEEVIDLKFQEAWQSLIKVYEDKGKISLFSSLSKYKPRLTENLEAEVTYDNTAQLHAINKERSTILEHLRNALKNDRIKLKLVVSEGRYQKAYTQAEKLEKMIEKNPDINLLKDTLDLDLGQ